VIVGNITLEKAQINPGYLIWKEISIVGSRGATIQEVQEVMELVEQRVLKPVVAHVMNLNEASKAQKMLLQRSVCGRIVLVPKLATVGVSKL